MLIEIADVGLPTSFDTMFLTSLIATNVFVRKEEGGS